MATICVTTLTGVGELVPVEVKPNWPKELSPHANTLSSARNASTCCAPATTLTTLLMTSSGEGVDPLPTPPGTIPHAHNIPLVSAATLNPTSYPLVSVLFRPPAATA